jgi:hypothetical protein
LATGTKQLGLFFVLTIPVYLLWGVFAKRITWFKALLNGLLFVAVMAAAVIASNPLLLLPQERAEIINTQVWQFSQTSSGIILKNTTSYFQGGIYPDDFRAHYGELVFILLALIGLVVGIIRQDSRRRSVLILTWMIPLTYTITVMATRRTHYFIPVALPLLSCLVYLFPEKKEGIRSRILQWAALALIVLQVGLFVKADVSTYLASLHKEETSASIAFYKQVQKRVAPLLPERGVAVYRDWGAYFPEHPHWRVEINWDLPTYEYFIDYKADLLLIQREYIKQYGAPEAVKNAVNPEHMSEVQAFYQDVANHTVKGYKVVYEDEFGVALVREK